MLRGTLFLLFLFFPLSICIHSSAIPFFHASFPTPLENIPRLLILLIIINYKHLPFFSPYLETPRFPKHVQHEVSLSPPASVPSLSSLAEIQPSPSLIGSDALRWNENSRANVLTTPTHPSPDQLQSFAGRVLSVTSIHTGVRG